MSGDRKNRFWLWLRELQWRAIAMTVGALGIVVLRMFFPNVFKFDVISLALIFLAVLPWLRSIVKSVEVAGVGKLELQDVENVARKVEDSGLPKVEPGEASAQEPAAGSPRVDAGTGGAEGNQRQGNEASDWPAAAAALEIVHSLPKDYSSKKLGSVVGRIASSYVGSDAWALTSTELAYADPRLALAAVLLKRALTRLGAEYGVPYSSSEDMIARLFGVGAIDEKQADALATASSLLRAARGLEASSLASQKTIDVVMNVVASLEVLREQAHLKRKSASAGANGQSEQTSGNGAAGGAEGSDNDRGTGDAPGR